MELYSSCSVFTLKQMIMEKTKIKISEQIISCKNDVFSNEKFLFQYLNLTPHLEEECKNGCNNFDNFNIVIVEEELTQSLVGKEISKKLPSFNISLIIKKVNPITKKVSVGLDFTFNSLRNVKRVNW